MKRIIKKLSISPLHTDFLNKNCRLTTRRSRSLSYKTSIYQNRTGMSYIIEFFSRIVFLKVIIKKITVFSHLSALFLSLSIFNCAERTFLFRVFNAINEIFKKKTLFCYLFTPTRKRFSFI